MRVGIADGVVLFFPANSLFALLRYKSPSGLAVGRDNIFVLFPLLLKGNRVLFKLTFNSLAVSCLGKNERFSAF